jgi:hypothetical protein
MARPILTLKEQLERLTWAAELKAKRRGGDFEQNKHDLLDRCGTTTSIHVAPVASARTHEGNHG